MRCKGIQMKRLVVTGLISVAAAAAAAAPAQAEGLTLIDSPSTGSARVVPDCERGPMVEFLGTGSAAVDLGAFFGALAANTVITGSANTGSGADAAVDGPCNDISERGQVTKLLTYLYSGSAHF